jgi:hypothetical protein
VDKLKLMVYPVVTGAGERLFGETSAQEADAARGHEDSWRRLGHPHV